VCVCVCVCVYVFECVSEPVSEDVRFERGETSGWIGRMMWMVSSLSSLPVFSRSWSSVS
jgi:hypothetical protein